MVRFLKGVDMREICFRLKNAAGGMTPAWGAALLGNASSAFGAGGIGNTGDLAIDIFA